MARVDSEWEKLLQKSQPSVFPDEFMFDILSRLPVKSIIRFKCVCQKWYELFEDSSFIAAHLKLSIEGSNCRYFLDNGNVEGGRYYLRDEKFQKLQKLRFETEPSFRYKVVGSVDGIVCITETAHWNIPSVLLWNPATRKSRTLPKCPASVCRTTPATGFGFDPKNNDYKVVMMIPFEESVEVYVYSLRTGKWRSVEVDYFRYYHFFGALVNGRLHWLACTLDCTPNDSFIVSFDLSKEKIINMDLPFYLDRDGIWGYPPYSFGKSLIIPFYSHEEVIKIWYMKKYGDTKSWSKLYTLPPHPGYRDMHLCSFLENGEVLLGTSGTSKMILCDPKNQVFKILSFNKYVDIFKYKESLLSFEGGRSVSYGNQCASISDSSTN